MVHHIADRVGTKLPRWAKISLTAGVGLAVLILPLLFPSFYHRQLLEQVLIFALLALGYDLLLGHTGQFSLGHIALFAIGSYTTALLSTKMGASFLVGLLAAAVVTGLVGLIIAVPALRIKGHYLVVLTLAFNEIIRLLLTNLRELTGGSGGITNIPSPALAGYSFDTPLKRYYLLLAFLVLGVLVIVRLEHSRFGRAFKAVRDAELAADVSGVNIARTKILSFVISAVFAGVAGALYAHTFHYISPEFFGLGRTIILLAMVIVGGKGSVAGVIAGVTLLTLLPEALRFVKQYYMVAFGLGVWLTTLFLPDGLVAIVSKLRDRWVPVAGARQQH